MMPEEKEQENETKLDLAKACEEMGDNAGAIELLEEVIRDGTEAQRRVARAMLMRLLNHGSPGSAASPASRQDAVVAIFARAIALPHADVIAAALLFAQERELSVGDALADAVAAGRYEPDTLARGLQAFAERGVRAAVAALRESRYPGVATAAREAAAKTAGRAPRPDRAVGTAHRALAAFLTDTHEAAGLATLVQLCAFPDDEARLFAGLVDWPGRMPATLLQWIGERDDAAALPVLASQWQAGADPLALAGAVARCDSAARAALLVRWLRATTDPARRTSLRSALSAGAAANRGALLDACAEDEAFGVEEAALLLRWHGIAGAMLLVRAIGSRFRHVREGAVRALASVGSDDADGSRALATRLIQFLEVAQDVDARAAVVEALGARPEPEVRRSLGDALASVDWEVRRAAAAALGRRRELEALEILSRGLGDPHPVVRVAVRAALDAFAGAGDVANVDGLLALAAGPGRLVAECATGVLQRMAAGEHGERVDRQLAARLQAAQAADRDVWVALRARLERANSGALASGEAAQPPAEVMEEVVRAIRAAASLESGLRSVLPDLCALFGASRATVYAVAPDRDSIASLAQSGLEKLPALKLPISSACLAGHVAKTRAGLNVADAYDRSALARIESSLRFLEEVDRRTGFRTRQVLAMPVLAPGTGEALGVVQLLNTRDGQPFPADTEIRLRRFCGAIAPAFVPRRPPDLDEDDFAQAHDNELVRLCNKLVADACDRGASTLCFVHAAGKGRTRCDLVVQGRREPYIEIPHSYRGPLTLRYRLLCRRAPGADVRGLRSGSFDLKEVCDRPGEARVEFTPGATETDDLTIHLPAASSDSDLIGDLLSGLEDAPPPPTPTAARDAPPPLVAGDQMDYDLGAGNDDPPAAAARPSPAPASATGSAVASDASAVPAPITDQVYFTVTAPRTVRAAAPFVLDVWGHLEGDRDAVLARAAEESADGAIRSKTKGATAISRGSRLCIRVRVPDFAFEDEDVLLWSGSAGNATFGVAVPPGTATGVHLGTATFHVEGLQVARLHFEIEVAASEGPREERTLRERRPRTAFASYASEDRDEVLSRIQGMQKLLPDLDVFLDIVSIRSGEDWAKRLEAEIAQRDAFYLFWSAAASRSEWVEREWRAALRLKGLEAIDPVPLASPQLAPPPSELGSLHFNEWTLAYRSR
jgi:FimV-like protein